MANKYEHWEKHNGPEPRVKFSYQSNCFWVTSKFNSTRAGRTGGWEPIGQSLKKQQKSWNPAKAWGKYRGDIDNWKCPLRQDLKSFCIFFTCKTYVYVERLCCWRCWRCQRIIYVVGNCFRHSGTVWDEERFSSRISASSCNRSGSGPLCTK